MAGQPQHPRLWSKTEKASIDKSRPENCSIVPDTLKSRQESQVEGKVSDCPRMLFVVIHRHIRHPQQVAQIIAMNLGKSAAQAG